MAKVHEQVGAHGGGGEVIDAASAVSHVGEYDALTWREGGHDVADGAREQQETLRQLQCDATRAARSHALNDLLDLKVVVAWELRAV